MVSKKSAVQVRSRAPVKALEFSDSGAFFIFLFPRKSLIKSPQSYSVTNNATNKPRTESFVRFFRLHFPSLTKIRIKKALDLFQCFLLAQNYGSISFSSSSLRVTRFAFFQQVLPFTDMPNTNEPA